MYREQHQTNSRWLVGLNAPSRESVQYTLCLRSRALFTNHKFALRQMQMYNFSQEIYKELTEIYHKYKNK